VQMRERRSYKAGEQEEVEENAWATTTKSAN